MITLSFLDGAIIFGFLVSVVLVGSLAAWRSSKSATDFFLSGRTMPWWLLGISMVACTFSCDTPNLITDIVRQNGVAGNWVWWAFLLTGTMTVFIYAKLWRRSKLDTDLGFYELRYSGKSAAFLRGFRAIYLGVFYNIIVLAGCSIAAIKIGQIMFGLSPVMSLVVGMTGVAVYSTLGGLTGSIWADFYQYSVAMIGAIFAAYYAVTSGMEGSGVTTLQGLLSNVALDGKMSIFPHASSNLSTWMTLLILPVAVQWWNVWYPGAEPGGGGFVAQRMLSAKNEQHAVGATLLFNFMHYAVRPWPWILVAFVSLVIFPVTTKDGQDQAAQWLAQNKEQVAVYESNRASLPDNARLEIRQKKADARGIGKLAEEFPNVDDQFLGHDIAYPGMIARMPKGWQGLIVASLIAAYMSTIATLLNWGSSYVIQDVYLRFIKPDASPGRAVWLGRAVMLAMLLTSAFVALNMTTAKNVFDLLLQVGAGTGLLYILRWFWWRMNVWSEVTAMVVSFLVACAFHFGNTAGAIEAAFTQAGMFEVMDFTAWKLVITIVVTTIAWVTVTYLTPPEGKEVLTAFVKKIHPGGSGWRPVNAWIAEADPAWKPGKSGLTFGIICMALGCVAIWTALFGIGSLLYGQTGEGIVLLAIAILSGGLLMKLVPKIQFE